MPDPLYHLTLVAWVAVIGYFLWWCQPGKRSVGMPLAYLLCLAAIHVPGAALVYLDAGPTANREETLAGFPVTLFALCGFVIGHALVALPGARSEPTLQPPRPAPPLRDARVATAYIIIGLALFIVGPAALRGIPTLSSSSAVGLPLAASSLCLSWWIVRRSGNKRAWLQLLWVPAFPAVTLFGHGFLSFAVAPLAVIYAFLICQTPRRGVAVLGLMVILVVSMQVFPTYFLSRDKLRASFWGGESLQGRVATTGEAARSFAFFDPTNPAQLEAIDNRLNQNTIVGRAVIYMSHTMTPFAWGSTFINCLLALVPRFLWPDKPAMAGGSSLVTLYTGVVYNDATSVGIGHVGELYVNFGIPGVAIGFLVIGAVLAMIDSRAAVSLRAGQFRSFLIVTMLGNALLHVNGNFAEATGGAVFGLALVFLVERFLPLQGLAGAAQARDGAEGASGWRGLERSWGDS
jgi:hypothetical protein